jgi:hypothetical protein
MPAPITVPARCCLRTAPKLPAGEVYQALGISRQRVHNWRKRYGWPASTGGMIDAAEVARWLAGRGCHVTWV